MDLKSAIRNAQKGQVDPVYFLQGNDHFLQYFFIEQVEKTFFAGGSVDRQLLLPDEMSSKEIVELLSKTDLFSSQRLFIIRNPQQIRDPYKKQLIEYCKKPVSSHCLIIIDDDFTKKTALIRDLSKIADPISTARPFENELRKWVAYFFKEKGLQADRTVVDAVIDIAGDSVYHAANEVEKISLGLDEGDVVTPEKVAQFSGWRREHQQWEFMQAVGNKNMQRTIILGKALLSQGVALISIIYQLTSLFQEMLYHKISAGTSSDKVGYIPLSPSVRKRIPDYCRRYEYEDIEKAIELLSGIDQRIKTSTVSDESELTVFLFSIVGTNG